LSAADPSSPTDLGVRPSWQQQKRPRIPVGKLFAMPDDRALVWRPGEEAPTVVRMRAYYEIPHLAARASPNPYVEKREEKSAVRPATTIAVMLGIAVTLLTLLLGP
jgi:type IV secretory pathway TraG/TraD family ATPase VirD4